MRLLARRAVVATVTAAAVVVPLACGDDGRDDGGTAVLVTTTTAAPTGSTGSTTGSTSTAPAPTGVPSSTGAATTTATTTAPTQPAPATSDPPTMGDPRVEVVEVARLDAPVDLAARPDDPALYVVEQAGRVVAIAPDRSTRVVLDVTDLTRAAGERGLLGLAFDPGGTTAYVDLTDLAGNTQILEFAVGDDGTFDRESQRLVLAVDQPYGNHNGGHLEFGPDGALYIGLGDGGSGGDPERRALDPTTLLGKLVRITPAPTADQAYGIPADNPFVGVPGARPEIFASGLRNPWSFTFDPVDGGLWIADVGQNRVEEVDHVAAPEDGGVAGRGLSFGWSAYEGTERFNADQPESGHVLPVLTYLHGDDGCSIAGGAPYHGSAIPELRGGYVYSDYCSGKLWALDLAGGRNVLLTRVSDHVTGVHAGPDGELYVLDADGPVRRIEPVS